MRPRGGLHSASSALPRRSRAHSARTPATAPASKRHVGAAALKLVGDLALESEASRAVRDAEVAGSRSCVARRPPTATADSGFFRDVALRGRTLRLATPVGGVTRVPRRGVCDSLRYLELREVPESVHLGGYLGRVGRVGVVGTRRKVPSGKAGCVPLMLPAARAERGGHHAPLQSLHLRGVFDAKFCRLAGLRVGSTSRRASNARRTSGFRHANCCPPRRQSRVLFLEAAARVGLQIINSRTRV